MFYWSLCRKPAIMHSVNKSTIRSNSFVRFDGSEKNRVCCFLFFIIFSFFFNSPTLQTWLSKRFHLLVLSLLATLEDSPLDAFSFHKWQLLQNHDQPWSCKIALNGVALYFSQTRRSSALLYTLRVYRYTFLFFPSRLPQYNSSSAFVHALYTFAPLVTSWSLNWSNTYPIIAEACIIIISLAGWGSLHTNYFLCWIMRVHTNYRRWMGRGLPTYGYIGNLLNSSHEVSPPMSMDSCSYDKIYKQSQRHEMWDKHFICFKLNYIHFTECIPYF